MKLYYAPGACSLSPHIVLREAGLSFELEQVDLKTKKTATGADFLQINPKGQVPALVTDEGEVLTEGPMVVQYIADQVKAQDLVPAAGMARYRVQEWLNYVTSELHKVIAPLWKPETPDATKAIIKESLAKQLAYLDRVLAGRSYLTGETFTAADAYLFAIVSWTRFFQISLKPYPNLQATMDRIAARPQVKESLQAEGLLKAAA